MKKYILSLVIILFATFSINADNTKINSTENEVEIEVFGECDDVYFAVRDVYFAITGDLVSAIRAAIAAENTCMENEVEIMEIPE